MKHLRQKFDHFYESFHVQVFMFKSFSGIRSIFDVVVAVAVAVVVVIVVVVVTSRAVIDGIPAARWLKLGASSKRGARRSITVTVRAGPTGKTSKEDDLSMETDFCGKYA